MRCVNCLGIIEENKNGYKIEFLDFDQCVGVGATIEDAIKSAKLKILDYIIDSENRGKNISQMGKIKYQNNQNLIIITVYPEIYRAKIEKKIVMLRVSLPLWMKKRADIEKVDYSELLKEALIVMFEDN